MVTYEQVRAIAMSMPGAEERASYGGHPIVLVDLDAVDEQEAHELIEESWRLRR